MEERLHSPRGPDDHQGHRGGSRLAVTARLLLLPLLLLWLSSVMAAPGCSERESTILDFDLVEEVVAGTGPFRIVIEGSNLDTHFQITRSNGSSVWTGIEKIEPAPVTAKTLVRFDADLELPVTASILSSRLTLVCDDGGDYGNAAATTIGIERATDGSWFEDTSLGGPWPSANHTPLSPDTELEVDACTRGGAADSTYSVELPTELIRDWDGDPDSNFGLVLVPRTGGFKRFSIADTELTVVYVVDEDTTTVTPARLEHATLYTLNPELESTGSGSEPVALVAGPYDYRGVLGFDLGSLPDSASIHKLELQLHLDAAAARTTGVADTLTVAFHRLVSIPGENLDARPPVSFLSTPTSEHTITATDSTVTLDISGFSTDVKDGILIKARGDVPSLVQFGFVTREGPAERRPRLEIVYTLPARIRL